MYPGEIPDYLLRPFTVHPPILNTSKYEQYFPVRNYLTISIKPLVNEHLDIFKIIIKAVISILGHYTILYYTIVGTVKTNKNFVL